MNKPLIGITCNYDYRDTVGIASGMGICGQDWNFLAGDYVYILERAGAVPVLIPRCGNFETLQPLLERLDGILVSGGHDIGPGQYGAPTKGYCGTVIPMRDDHDLAVARYAFAHQKAVLGICRGIQVLNVARGGTIYQDIEKEGGFENHFGDRYPRNFAWHDVILSENSQLWDIFSKERVSVNSFHHQAVLKPGEGVKIVARSADGVPEAIEVEGFHFAVGVQWHPEMMFDSEEQFKLFKAFVNAAQS